MGLFDTGSSNDIGAIVPSLVLCLLASYVRKKKYSKEKTNLTITFEKKIFLTPLLLYKAKLANSICAKLTAVIHSLSILLFFFLLNKKLWSFDHSSIHVIIMLSHSVSAVVVGMLNC